LKSSKIIISLVESIKIILIIKANVSFVLDAVEMFFKCQLEGLCFLSKGQNSHFVVEDTTGTARN
jgi:hypothetical protein